MIDPMQELLKLSAIKSSPFPSTSRYHGIDTTTLETVEGRTIIYLRRRFIPPPVQFALLQEHTVSQGDRLDNLAAHYLGNPEQFWRLCDANGAMDPNELTECAGKTLRITLPEGIPGARTE